MMCWLDRSMPPCSNIGLQSSVNDDVDALYLSRDWKSQQKTWILAQEGTENNLFETMQVHLKMVLKHALLLIIKTHVKGFWPC